MLGIGVTEHQELVADSVRRALNSLKPGYEFAILGFQVLDSGPRFHRWPEGNQLAAMSRRNRTEAFRFINRLSGRYAGSSSFPAAFEQAFSSPAEAIVLFSDGLPNPVYNNGLPPGALIQNITMSNARGSEIHAVTIGDYFKYKGTVEFMEALAKANAGDFLALAQ